MGQVANFTPAQREAVGGVIAMLARGAEEIPWKPADLGWTWVEQRTRVVAVTDDGVEVSDQDMFDAALIIAVTAIRDRAREDSVDLDDPNALTTAISQIIASYGARLALTEVPGE